MPLLPCAFDKFVLRYQFVPDTSGCVICKIDTDCNACRFAALSVGRVEDGQLFCRYHGWGFKGGEEGRCSCNPQAVGPEAETTVLNSSRSRLQTYPSQVIVCLLSRTVHGIRCKHNRHFHVRQTQTCWYMRGLSCCVRASLYELQCISQLCMGPSPAKALKRGMCM